MTDSRVVDDDIDFNVTDSRVVDDESDIDFNITDSRVITNRNAKIAPKNIKQKYKNIRQRKELKSLRLAALRDQNNKDPASKKSAILTAKKISKKYRNLRKHKTADLVADVQETLTKKKCTYYCSKNKPKV